MINLKLERYLQTKCKSIDVSAHNVIDNTINKIKEFYEIKPVVEQAPGKQHSLSEEDYFDRMESLQYAIANDDGHKSNLSLDKADIIFGVSRTSKTPTSIYLANQGYKVVNIPTCFESKFRFI